MCLPEDVYVYGSSSSHRVLPPSFGRNSSANHSEFANGIDMQGRLNLENRIIDSDERAVYQEALQACAPLFLVIEAILYD